MLYLGCVCWVFFVFLFFVVYWAGPFLRCVIWLLFHRLICGVVVCLGLVVWVVVVWSWVGVAIFELFLFLWLVSYLLFLSVSYFVL